MSHWQFSGIFTFSSGAPLTISDSNCVSGGILGTCYPNYNAGFSGPIWINGTPGTGECRHYGLPEQSGVPRSAPYTVGDVARSAPFSLYAPHTADFDISVRREFRIVERVKLHSRPTRSISTIGALRARRGRTSIPQRLASSRRRRISLENCSSARAFRSSGISHFVRIFEGRSFLLPSTLSDISIFYEISFYEINDDSRNGPAVCGSRRSRMEIRFRQR